MPSHRLYPATSYGTQQQVSRGSIKAIEDAAGGKSLSARLQRCILKPILKMLSQCTNSEKLFTVKTLSIVITMV